MTVARQRTGALGEELVARELSRRGWAILARNTRVDGVRGELDIVALDGRDLVIVEVKTCRVGELGPASPLEQVTHRKRAKLRALAAAWARANPPPAPYRGLRIDVVGLRLDARDRVVEWEHVRGAV
ncbi:MAG TPA: YraN family protein [Solirubrobacterales bacterium]